MADKHLNLFYSYNRDNELIENNLTRAFIQTVRFLSPDIRHTFLQKIFKEPMASLRAYSSEDYPSFKNAQSALQSNISGNLVNSCRQKYIVGLSSYDTFERESEKAVYDGIPDAWIYDPEEGEGYVLLIETKVGGNILGSRQLKRHALSWLGIPDFSNYLLIVSWFGVLKAIEETLIWHTNNNPKINRQEQMILKALAEFLGFRGYRLFKGFNFEPLQHQPNFRFAMIRSIFGAELRDPPNFKFGL